MALIIGLTLIAISSCAFGMQMELEYVARKSKHDRLFKD